jgi:hypothetical protein
VENIMIIERLKREAKSSEVAECVVRMFAFEVENAPKKKPHFKEPFADCMKSCMPKPDEDVPADSGSKG